MARSRGRGLELEEIKKAEEKARAQANQVRRKSVFTVLGIVIGLAAIAAFILLQPPPPGVAFPSLGNQHLTALTDPHAPYNSSPPSSGPHFGGLAPWGANLTEVIPPELFIHNLEDGGIVLTYSCREGCTDITEGLVGLVDDHVGERLLVTEYPGIVDPDGVAQRGAAVAWGRVLYFDEWNTDVRDEIETFIRLYEGLDNHAR
ncbi:MAG: DUF3105 domain-containing protein [Acidimicrobiia bacterium]|nr:DUF3105 domain-containing protein [Acidimicrobiia bacterium]